MPQLREWRSYCCTSFGAQLARGISCYLLTDERLAKSKAAEINMVTVVRQEMNSRSHIFATSAQMPGTLLTDLASHSLQIKLRKINITQYVCLLTDHGLSTGFTGQ